MPNQAVLAGNYLARSSGRGRKRTEARMGVRLLGRAMLGQLVTATNYDFVRTAKSYDLVWYAK